MSHSIYTVISRRFSNAYAEIIIAWEFSKVNRDNEVARNFYVARLRRCERLKRLMIRGI